MSSVGYDMEHFIDRVPKNIREQYELMVENWEKDDLVFYETRGAKSVKEAIKIHSVITVTGSVGAGKSAAIHHVALGLQKEGYSILPVMGINDILEYLQQSKKQCFVVKNPVGELELDRKKLDEWLQYNSLFGSSLISENTKIFLSIRKQVLDEPGLEIEKCILNKNVVDMEDIENKLNDREKIGMIKQHLKVKNVDLKFSYEAELILKGTHDLFPLLCKTFCSSREYQDIGWTFFKNPIGIIVEELDKMQCFAKIKYCVLVLCFAFGNCLDPQIFNPFQEQNQREQAFPYQMACGIKREELISSYRENAQSLLGLYLQKQGRSYKFSRDSIHDAVTYHFGKSHHGQLIKLGSSKFICERVFVNKETVPKDDPHVIILKEDLFPDLLERLLVDIEKGIYNHVFMNKCWDDQNFMKGFISSFRLERKGKMQRFYEKIHGKKQKILDLFCRNQYKNRDEFRYEYNRLDGFGKMDSWPWYFKAMKMLIIPGITALHWVVTFAHRSLFSLIWDNLSSIQRKQVSEKVPLLHLACLGGDVEICKILLEAQSNKVSTPYYKDGEFILGVLPLHCAVYKNADVVQLLIDHGAQVNAIESRKGKTSLFYAAGHGSKGILEGLIKQGADVNACSIDGNSPLMFAAQNSNTEAIKLLLDHHASVDLCDNNGWNALMKATFKNHARSVKILLEHHCDVNMCDREGNSALMIASFHNNLDIYQLLLQHHCDVNLCNKNGDTALSIAEKENSTDVIKLLKSI